MSDFTILEENQINGDYLELFERRLTKAVVTDYAVLLGGYKSNRNYIGGDEITGGTGCYWIKTRVRDTGSFHIINEDGQVDLEDVVERYVGARVVLPLSSIDSNLRCKKKNCR